MSVSDKTNDKTNDSVNVKVGGNGCLGCLWMVALMVGIPAAYFWSNGMGGREAVAAGFDWLFTASKWLCLGSLGLLAAGIMLMLGLAALIKWDEYRRWG